MESRRHRNGKRQKPAAIRLERTFHEQRGPRNRQRKALFREHGDEIAQVAGARSHIPLARSKEPDLLRHRGLVLLGFHKRNNLFDSSRVSARLGGGISARRFIFRHD